MQPQNKYARIEYERRFLLDRFPSNTNVVRIRRITDHYIEGTGLRLREERENGRLNASGICGFQWSRDQQLAAYHARTEARSANIEKTRKMESHR